MARKNIFDLSGKVALITGGGSGLGRAYCEAMAEFGAAVACADILEERAQETVRLIKKYGHGTIALKADASKQDEIRNMVDKTVREFGSLDIVFANAGFMENVRVRIHEYSIEDWDRVFSIHTRGTFLLMQAAFPVMMGQRSGSFITIGSTLGMWPILAGGTFHLHQAYGAAKAGIIILTKMAARQYGEYGIRVNSICPGVHRTNISPAEGLEKIENLVLPFTPLGRVGMPEDIKGLAVYLASAASGFVTGQIFVHDGGHTA